MIANLSTCYFSDNFVSFVVNGGNYWNQSWD
jgi:hypothetical protein